MTNIFYSPEFRKEIKHLAKKYRSIPEDLIELAGGVPDEKKYLVNKVISTIDKVLEGYEDKVKDSNTETGNNEEN